MLASPPQAQQGGSMSLPIPLIRIPFILTRFSSHRWYTVYKTRQWEGLVELIRYTAFDISVHGHALTLTLAELSRLMWHSHAAVLANVQNNKGAACLPQQLLLYDVAHNKSFYSQSRLRALNAKASVGNHSLSLCEVEQTCSPDFSILSKSWSAMNSCTMWQAHLSMHNKGKCDADICFRHEGVTFTVTRPHHEMQARPDWSSLLYTHTF